MTQDMREPAVGGAIQNLFGTGDENVRLLEQLLNVHIALRGGEIIVEGEREQAVDRAEAVLARLGALCSRGERVDTALVQYAVHLAETDALEELDTLFQEVVATTFRGRPIRCKTLGQRAYVRAIKKNTLTLGIGPAGTGKTYLAMAMAVTALKSKEVERIVLTRPAVEAGEKLGFLPGDLNQKVDPYLRPLYDAMFEMLGAETCQRMQERGVIEVAPLAYMRGRTLSDAFIILDEAQNTTQEQMKMFLTRMGFRSKIVVTGDPSQIDLPRGRKSGLLEAVEVLAGVPDIAVQQLTHEDVVRHELVQAIVRAYDAHALRAKEERADGRFAEEKNEMD
ncbi:MAG: PhoH family protein [Christensenellales bacterium]|nr:PhoH family protein [Christensenellales bacterium]